jgi:hypothetical protein
MKPREHIACVSIGLFCLQFLTLQEMLDSSVVLQNIHVLLGKTRRIKIKWNWMEHISNPYLATLSTLGENLTSPVASSLHIGPMEFIALWLMMLWRQSMYLEVLTASFNKLQNKQIRISLLAAVHGPPVD